MPRAKEPTQYQCRHIKPDGHRCGSPALRREHFCYFHHAGRRCGPRQPQVNTAVARKTSTFQLPSPADLSEPAGVGLAVGQILHKIANAEIDPRRAGLLLYGLQIASMNLKGKHGRSAAESDWVEEVSLDPDHGPLAPKTEFDECATAAAEATSSASSSAWSAKPKRRSGKRSGSAGPSKDGIAAPSSAAPAKRGRRAWP